VLNTDLLICFQRKGSVISYCARLCHIWSDWLRRLSTRQKNEHVHFPS